MDSNIREDKVVYLTTSMTSVSHPLTFPLHNLHDLTIATTRSSVRTSNFYTEGEQYLRLISRALLKIQNGSDVNEA